MHFYFHLVKCIALGLWAVMNELNVTLSFMSVHNKALFSLLTSAEVHHVPSCVRLCFNGSVVVMISVSFQWKAGVIPRDFLLHSLFLALKSGHLCVSTKLGCFFKSFACPRFIGVVTTVSFRLKLNFDLQSLAEAQSDWLYNYCPLYKMKLFILDANTCTEFE